MSEDIYRLKGGTDREEAHQPNGWPNCWGKDYGIEMDETKLIIATRGFGVLESLRSISKNEINNGTDKNNRTFTSGVGRLPETDKGIAR